MLEDLTSCVCDEETQVARVIHRPTVSPLWWGFPNELAFAMSHQDESVDNLC